MTLVARLAIKAEIGIKVSEKRPHSILISGRLKDILVQGEEFESLLAPLVPKGKQVELRVSKKAFWVRKDFETLIVLDESTGGKEEWYKEKADLVLSTVEQMAENQWSPIAEKIAPKGMAHLQCWLVGSPTINDFHIKIRSLDRNLEIEEEERNELIDEVEKAIRKAHGPEASTYLERSIQREILLTAHVGVERLVGCLDLEGGGGTETFLLLKQTQQPEEGSTGTTPEPLIEPTKVYEEFLEGKLHKKPLAPERVRSGANRKVAGKPSLGERALAVSKKGGARTRIHGSLNPEMEVCVGGTRVDVLSLILKPQQVEEVVRSAVKSHASYLLIEGHESDKIGVIEETVLRMPPDRFSVSEFLIESLQITLTNHDPNRVDYEYPEMDLVLITEARYTNRKGTRTVSLIRVEEIA